MANKLTRGIRSSCPCLLMSVIVATLITTFYGFSHSCTGLYMKEGDHYVFARNFEWPGSEGIIIVNKRGISKKAMIAYLGAENPAEWVSRFGSVTINQAGWDLPNFGINEAGLSVQGFIFPRAKYPEKDARPAIAQVQWKQYILDTCETVDQVLNVVKAIRIESPTSRFGLHYFVCDGNGECVSIDFMNNETILHTGKGLPVKAFVDTYAYAECIDHLKKHEGFGGDRTAGQGSEGKDRFVRVAYEMKENNTHVDNVFRMLDVAKIGGYTKWQIVYDSKSGKIYYRTRKNQNIRAIDFRGLSFSCKDPMRFTDLESTHEGSVNANLMPYDPKAYGDFMDIVAKIYRFSPRITQLIKTYPNTIVCE